MDLLNKINYLEQLQKEVVQDALKYLEDADIDPVYKEMLYGPFMHDFAMKPFNFDRMRKRLESLEHQIKFYKNYKLTLK
jgi:response regulator of citrate/malate metabolism